MKRFFSLIGLFALSAAIFSCNKTAPEDTKPAGGLSFEQASYAVFIGENVQLVVNGVNEGERLKYESSDKTVATVTQSSGKVTGVKAGTVTITVTSRNDVNRKATCTVKVNEKPAGYVAITGLTVTAEGGATSINLKEGNTATLTATVNPDNATDKASALSGIEWTSDKTTVATVSKGVVTAKTAGTAKITAKVKDANGNPFTGSVTVTVKSANVPTTGVSLPASGRVQPGKTLQLAATLTPEDHTDAPTLSWKSDKTNIATVSNTGLVTGVAEGKANITVTASVGSQTYSSTCEVTVQNVTLVMDAKTVSFPYTWPEADEYTLDNVTMETWIKTAGKSGGNESIIGIEGVFLIRTESSQWQVIAGGNKKSNEEYEEIKLATAWTTNQWTHLAATYSKAGKIRLYVNGELKAEQDAKDHGVDMNGIKKSTGLRPGENDSQWGLIPFSFVIGNACDAGRFIQGTIAYTRVWTVERTAAQISADMNKATPTGDGLLANWYFTEGSGNTIADHSGKGHNLTAKTWTSSKPRQQQDADINWIEGDLPF